MRALSNSALRDTERSDGPTTMNTIRRFLILLSLVCGIGLAVADSGNHAGDKACCVLIDAQGSAEAGGGGNEGETLVVLDCPAYCNGSRRAVLYPSVQYLPFPPIHPELRPPIDLA